MTTSSSTFTLILVAGLLLTGCASPSATATSDDRAEQAPAEVAEPTQVAAADPEAVAQDLGDPAAWIVSGDGLGPILLGTDVAGYAAVGPYGEVPSDCPNPAVHRLAGDGLHAIQIVTDDSLSAVGEASVTSWGSTGALPSPKTAKGIGLGSSLGELQAAYPAITVAGTYQDQYAVRDGSGWIVFVVQDDRVVVVASSSAATLPGEYCG